MQGELVLRISTHPIYHSKPDTRYPGCSNISADLERNKDQVCDVLLSMVFLVSHISKLLKCTLGLFDILHSFYGNIICLNIKFEIFPILNFMVW